jgi:hypothetical protein
MILHGVRPVTLLSAITNFLEEAAGARDCLLGDSLFFCLCRCVLACLAAASWRIDDEFVHVQTDTAPMVMAGRSETRNCLAVDVPSPTSFRLWHPCH